VSGAQPDGETSLLASFWTLAGDLQVRDPGPSPWPFEKRVAAAAAAGYAGIGIDHRDVVAYLAGYGLRRMRDVVGRAGLAIVELELVTGWFDDGTLPNADPTWVLRRRVREELFQAAEILGARHVKIGGGLVDTGVGTNVLVESFSALCDRAASAGTNVVLELLPGGPVATLERAVEIIFGAGAPNGGLLLDAWHVQRAGISPAAIAALPAGVLRYVEICDGAASSTLSPFEDTTTNRLLCGEGEFDLPGFIRSVRAAGYDGPYGVEILSRALRTRPLDEIARRSASTAAAVLADA
jgi:sugar phosphate isomerase/epimerase